MSWFKSGFFLLIIALLTATAPAWGQACTTLGQTPSTAFPVCGITTFEQNNVPICSSNDLFVPGCDDGAAYANKNPFWYKFTCYVSGTLNFLITPNNLADDYDWQLYDVTGLSPDEVFTNQNIIVTGNWSGSSGTTGAAPNGIFGIGCASNPADNTPTFAKSPTLIAGHNYILLVSHYTDSQSGYALSFNGGTAVITDPNEPHLKTATTDCDGLKLTVKLNKSMKCSSLSANGSEFRLSPAATAITAATTNTCTSGFDMDEITLTLASPLPAGSYQLIIQDGADGNSLLDNCDRAIPDGEDVTFQYVKPVPIFADSIGSVGCSPRSIKIYFPKKIDCSTIAPDGSDFSVAGPVPVTVIGATGNCVNNEAEYVIVNFASPIYDKGNYVLTLKTGVDGTTIVDECGLELPTQTLDFPAADTVSARFTYSTILDCRFNKVTFSHDGAHDVTSWNWTINNTSGIRTRTTSMTFPATSNNSVQCVVSNGVCTDSSRQQLVMDNEVIAGFDMPDILCPEDPLKVTNTSTGLIDSWRWNYDVLSSSTLKTPDPYLFPNTNRDAVYSIKLVATNNTLGCSDSVRKSLHVLNNCFIAVPSAFTPNGDGLNDFLFPNNAIKAENLEFRVYNRWGQMVFHSTDWTKKWDGKIGGILQSPGVFVWFLSYTHRDTKQRVFQKGTTTLIL